MSALQIFKSGNWSIRTMVREDGEIIFVAKDVCAALGIKNSSDAISALDDDEKITVGNSDGNPRAGIPHTYVVVTESGLYKLIFQSRKPEAKKFQRWVTHDVLPALRKTGAYSLPAANDPDADHPLIVMTRKYLEFERQQRAADRRILLLEAQVQREPDEFTVMGYAILREFELDLSAANKAGREAAKLSRERGVPIGKSTDPRFGVVNTYKLSILDEVFNMSAASGF